MNYCVEHTSFYHPVKLLDILLISPLVVPPKNPLCCYFWINVGFSYIGFNNISTERAAMFYKV